MRLSIFAAFASFLVSCQSTNYAPEVVALETRGSEKGQHVNQSTLRNGRVLFVHRCIECHTLPVAWHYTAEDWPRLIDSMSHRASLKPDEREAILAYILAARF